MIPFNKKVLDYLKIKYPKIKFGIEHRGHHITVVRGWTPKKFRSISVVNNLNKLLSPLKKVAILKEQSQTRNHVSGMEFGFLKVEILREGKGGHQRTD